MTDTLQELGPYERMITVAVAESDLESAKNRAARKISREIKIKGFRPGKAPRRVVEATVGEDRVRAEAIDEVLPDLVGDALEEASIEPAVTPVIETFRDVDGGVEIDVRVTLWPKLEAVPNYIGREIEVEHADLEETAIQGQMDRLREQFAELETVARPAQEGDFAAINLSTTRNGQPLEEVSATDLLYEVGSASFVDGLDRQLVGRSAGNIEQFDTTLPERFGELAGAEVKIQVLVKEIKEKRLPELTDEWVSDFTEFDTLADLRSELTGRMEEMRQASTRTAFQARLVESLLDELEIEIPEGLVNAEMEEIFHRFSHQLSESGIEFNDYLQVTGMTQEAFLDDLKRQASRSVSTDVLLDAVVAAADLTVEDGEMEAVYQGLAAQSTEEPEALAERFAGTVQEKRIVSDILRRKALETVVLGAVAVDESGSPIDLGFEDVDPSGEDAENGVAADWVENGDPDESSPDESSPDESSPDESMDADADGDTDAGSPAQHGDEEE